jgi:hypothetical protein
VNLSAALLTLGALNGAASASELSVTPYVSQGISLHLSDEIMAGGIGGGCGAQAIVLDRYLAEADVNLFWLLGNSVSTRFAAGVQHRGLWSPAGWLTAIFLFGDRLELLREDGTRAPIPNFGVGVRVSPLRFVTRAGFVSVSEPGVATDFAGGVTFELTILKAGARF